MRKLGFGRLALASALVAVAALFGQPASAEETSSARDAALEATFTVGMASMFAEKCSSLSIDEKARRIFWLRHEEELIRLGDGDSSWRNVRFSDSDFDEFNAAFAEKHGFTASTTLFDFCLAGKSEVESDSNIGGLLKLSN